MKEEKLKQLTFCENGSTISVYQENLDNVEELMNVLLNGTIATIRNTIPKELINIFIEEYIKTLKDANQDFDNSFTLKEIINIDPDEYDDAEEKNVFEVVAHD